jgi:hypothetical protein
LKSAPVLLEHVLLSFDGVLLPRLNVDTPHWWLAMVPQCFLPYAFVFQERPIIVIALLPFAFDLSVAESAK